MSRHESVAIFIILAVLTTSPLVLDDAKARAANPSTPSLSWAKIYTNGSASVVQQTSDGGYIVGGVSGLNPSLVSQTGYFWVLKVNRVGGIVWQKSYGGGMVNSLEQTKDGGYIAAGSGKIIKLDANGKVVWQKLSSTLQISSIQQTSDGGFVAAGQLWEVGRGQFNHPTDAWIGRLDSHGTVLWQKAIGDHGRPFYLGGGPSNFDSVIQTRDGGFMVAGNTDALDGVPGQSWVVRFDAVGNLLWETIYSGAYITGTDSIQQTSDGGYILSGWTILPNSAWLLKLDSSGEIVWQRGYAHNVIVDVFSSVRQTSDGGYVAVGTGTSGTNSIPIYLIVVRVDSRGNVIWQRAIGDGNSDAGYSVEQTRDDGFIVAGGGLSLHSDYLLLVKLDKNGNCCARIIGQTSTPMVEFNASRITTTLTTRENDLGPLTNSTEVGVTTDTTVLTLCHPRATH